MKTLTAKFLLLLATISSFGCASSDPIQLSQEGPNMKELYKSHVSGGDVNSLQAKEHAPAVLQPIEHYEAPTEFTSRLPNPDLKMFMYPHRNEADSVIIPGYEFTFPMYDRVHYTVLGQ